MKVTTRGATEIRACPDCGSEHIGPPCGLSFRDRLRSVRAATEWMPSVADDRARGTKTYYDDAPLKEMFGLDRKDRREIMADDTKGFGPIYSDTPYNPAHYDAVLGKETTDD